MHETRIAEQIRRAPQELDAGALHFLLERLDDRIEVGVRLAQVLAFGRHIAVVEAVVRDAELFHELESDLDALGGHLHRFGAVFPRPFGAPRAKRIAAHAAEGVPVADGEAQVLLHRLAFDHLIGVVVAKSERVLRVGPFEFERGDVGKERHGGSP